MEALLLCGGDAPPRQRLASRLEGFALVCAADSGLDVAKAWGIVPDIIVGDMDSVSDPALVLEYPSSELLVLPGDKDESDTELGLIALARRGASRIVLAGGGGGRLDHLLAIRALFERTLRPAEWHTAGEIVILLPSGGQLEFMAAPGATVSVFPLAAGASGMSSEGLVWNLEGLRWGAGDFGLSNRTVGGRVRLRAGEGDLLVVRLT